MSSEVPNALDSAQVTRQMIADEIPELRPILDALVEASETFIRHAHGSYGVGPSDITVLLSQALNDFLDALSDIASGRGRPAVRSARSLFELMVAAKDVFSNLEMEQRYADHRFVVEQLEATLPFEPRTLRGKPKKADANYRKKLARDSLKGYEEALKKYGPGFKKSWASQNLYDRAKAHGHEEDYDFYRLSSAFLHGSSGGALGISKTIDQTVVYRTGPALLLCPLAFLQSLRYFDVIVRTYESNQQKSQITSDLRQAIRNAKQLWQNYRKAVLTVDRAIWPDVPPSGFIALLVTDSITGLRRWYVHDPNSGRVRAARPPAHIEPEQETYMRSLLKFHQEQYPSSPELLSIAMFGVHVEPEPGSEWQDERLVLASQTPWGWNRPHI